MIREYALYVEKETGRSKVKQVKTYQYEPDTEFCDSPDSVYKMLEETVKLSTYAEERVYAVYLNTKCKIIGISLISHGTINASMLSPREVYLRALLLGATHVIVAHNHPSQVTCPSKEDVAAMRRMKDAGNLLNLRLIDSIIVGEGYYSFKESSLIS